MRRPHLWLALSPHGYGHAAMTAPIIGELQRRLPQMRLTIQTSVSASFLRSRYDGFSLVPQIADFGFVMHSSTQIDLRASARKYADLWQQCDHLVQDEIERLSADRPDLILANVPFITLLAAQALGIRSVAYSSINWLDMYAHYLADESCAPQIMPIMRTAYESAELFLCPTPAQPMTLSNIKQIGPVAQPGRSDRLGLCRALGLPDPALRVGLVSFGGIDHPLNWSLWPKLEGWVWLCPAGEFCGRDDLIAWDRVDMPFRDIFASVDVVITKTGYGTFSEAAILGIPVLYIARPDWPEAAPLETWLTNHTRSLSFDLSQLSHSILAEKLHTLFSMPTMPMAVATGNGQGAEILAQALCDLP